MPQLGVEMFRVRALHALPRTETQIDRSPRGKKGRRSAQLGGRRATATEACGKAREAAFVKQPLGARRFHFIRNKLERLVPGDAHETRILVASLLRIRALHRIKHAVRSVGLLHETEGLDASLAGARMHRGSLEIWIYFGGHAVLDANSQQVRPRYALVAVGRDAPIAVWLAFPHSLPLILNGRPAAQERPS